jgi:hypothetical protein
MTPSEDLPQHLKSRLVDDFAKNLFIGASRVLEDAENPVRLHMFSSTIREVVSYTLHYLAPDAEMHACSWFELAQNTDKPTRRQRIDFCIHGGISPALIEEELFLDIDDMSTNLRKAYDNLNKLTHVRPDTLVTDAQAIKAQGESILAAMSEFLDNIEACRSAIVHALEDKVHDAVYDAIAAETLPELDELASHYSLEEHDVESIHVTAIDSEWIRMTVKASLTVGLQWGSNSDVRNDIGAVGEQEFPLTAAVKASVHDFSVVEADEDQPVAVDTSSWWQNYHDDNELGTALEDPER